jgi:hypothetical protein
MFESRKDLMRVAKRWIVVVATLLIGSLFFIEASCSPGPKARVAVASRDGQAGTAPAKTDAAQPPRPAPTFVANPFCKACHLNFDDEKLAKTHEQAGIGCERCHGESLRHRSDEANVTPPELMYPKERINPTCMMCHPRQTIQQVEKHRPILEAGLSVFEEAAPADPNARKYCTDCHGRDHRPKTRTIQWDKCTGQLLPKTN